MESGAGNVDAQTLLQMAMSDPLTGLPNRRAIEEQGERLIREALAKQRPLAVAMVDIDFFKSFNDRFGHAAGDECLCLVGAALAGNLCAGDFAGRLGGEEFVVIFADCSVDQAVARAERLREAVRAIAFAPSRGTPVSASIGVAPVTPHAEDAFHAALSQADVALYDAKASGRDRVVVYDPSLARREATPSSARPAELPQLRSAVFGRDAMVEKIRHSLESDHVITLTGSGGCGKSTLAIVVASGLADRFEQGITFFELAVVSDVHLVPVRLCDHFGIRAADEASALSALRTYLRRQRMLLLLDNCEHVVSGVAKLVEALSPTHELRILATSREPLGVAAERAIAVPPLDEASAVATFRSRAIEAAQGALEPSRGEIAEICRRLDGIPLAIELAAAQFGSMTIGELQRWLASSTGPNGVGARAQERTLRALYDLSYERLSEGERAVFRSLSIFSGGWTLSAAAEVCGLEADVAMDALTLLEQRALVVRRHSRETGNRYAMLESAREYAHVRAVEAGEYPSLVVRHRTHFATRSERAKRAWEATPTKLWLPPLARELENVRVALSRSTPDESESLRLRLAFLPVLFDLGLPHEGMGHIDVLLGAASSNPEVRAEAYVWRARFGNALWRHVDALAAADAAIALAAEAGETRILADALANAAGARLALRDDFDRARRQLDEAMEIYEKQGARSGNAFVHSLLGVKDIIERGDATCALVHYEAALDVYREIGRLDGMARTLTNIAIAYGMESRSGRALAAASEAVELLEEMHNTALLAIAVNNLASLFAERGFLDAARTSALRGLQLNLTVSNRLQAVRSLGVVAEVAIRSGRGVIEALRLYGFERAEYARRQTPPQPHQAAYVHELTLLALERLGDSGATRYVDEGERLTLEEAVDLAHAL